MTQYLRYYDLLHEAELPGEIFVTMVGQDPFAGETIVASGWVERVGRLNGAPNTVALRSTQGLVTVYVTDPSARSIALVTRVD